MSEAGTSAKYSAPNLIQSTEILDMQDDLDAFRQAVREWTRRTAPPEKSHLWLKATPGADQAEIDKWWMRSIAAGSNEIMRNMIAERGLGMPR